MIQHNPYLRSRDDLNMLIATDTFYVNLPDGVPSAGGYNILLCGKDNKAIVLSWSSSKLKCVVKSFAATVALFLFLGLEQGIIKELYKFTKLIYSSKLLSTIKTYI